MSINLVKAQHPSWSSSQVKVSTMPTTASTCHLTDVAEHTPFQVNAAAQKAFETAALAFFVETMKLAVSMRPKAKWGYYG